jgi:nucleoside phosphorylase
MNAPDTYTVGWICAIHPAYVAAQEFLDEEHGTPAFVAPRDDNTYTLGKFGQHKVVIASLPCGDYGTASASRVAANMLASFPNIRFGLLVGTAGGAPSMVNDVRLGDIVIGVPSNGESGVFQYDFGKTIQGQPFQHTRTLNQPPTVLMSAVSNVMAKHQRKGHQIQQAIDAVLDKSPKLRQQYQRPGNHTDRLFKSPITHDPSRTISESDLVQRRERTKEEDNPAIHYGLIASANQLMKDAIIRDRFASEKNVLCFEMEAGGLMNSFPCLVIRGICNYSDTHKSKEWQGYAAMAASAYAKDILKAIPPPRVDEEWKFKEVVEFLQQRLVFHNATEDTNKFLMSIFGDSSGRSGADGLRLNARPGHYALAWEEQVADSSPLP